MAEDPRVTADDVVRMRAQLFLEDPGLHRRVSRYCTLLVLAAIIASAGVAGDSTATVIGAMIVAPLMAPILGIALAVVLNDRKNLLRCIATVFVSVLVVIALSFLLGLLIVEPVTAADNSQVASRVSPKLLDLLAALATGVVGSVALVRSDISDTLPGVAIAISLVPPLTVVGLTLESGQPSEAYGALLLFLANVSAILATGVITMAIHGMLAGSRDAGGRLARWRQPGLIVVSALVVVVAVPLTATSANIARTSNQQATVSRVVGDWAAASDWDVDSVTPVAGGFVVRVAGPLPDPDTEPLNRALTDAGLAGVTVRVELVPETRVTLRPGGE
ncbi:MAG TPA: TIGR00341 family protein [Microlunatus sp.]|nr:TIGR00341 family protein [Microlunatus sp.]